MFTRITTGHYDPANEQDAHRMIGDTVLAAARKMPGFKGYTGSLDHHGNFVVISTWTTEEQAHDFRDKLDGDIVQQIRDLGVKLDEAQIYEQVTRV